VTSVSFLALVSTKKSAAGSIGHPSFLKHFFDLKMWKAHQRNWQQKLVCFIFPELANKPSFS
jgi:hypothetical protein